MARTAHVARSSGPAKRGAYLLFKDGKTHEMRALYRDFRTPFSFTTAWVTVALKREPEYVKKCRIVAIRVGNKYIIGRHLPFEMYPIEASTVLTVDWVEF